MWDFIIKLCLVIYAIIYIGGYSVYMSQKFGGIKNFSLNTSFDSFKKTSLRMLVVAPYMLIRSLMGKPIDFKKADFWAGLNQM